MKRLCLILALTIGLIQSVSATNIVDSLEQAHPNLSTKEKIELYNNHQKLQETKENAFYYELINQLSHSFQAKKIQVRYSQTFAFIYSVLIVALSVSFLVILYFIQRFIRLHRIEKKNKLKIQELLDNTVDINTVKAQFLQEISFRIRTPLNSVMGLSDILANNPELIDSEEVKMVAETIQDNSRQLQLLVNAVLDLSRLEAGMMKYDMMDYSLSQICRDAVSIIKMHSEESLPEIPFENHLDATPDTIHTDVIRLTHILAEMLTTPHHKAANEKEEAVESVHLSLEICKEKNTSLCVTVKNSPMTQDADEDSLNSIRLKIAQLFIEHFGGTFSIQFKDIIFTYPLK